MRKSSAAFFMLAAIACFNGASDRPVLVSGLYAQSESAAAEAAKEDAQILYDEAVDLKKQGNMAAAIESYTKAMRLDRSILALDDFGLIEALKKDCEEKLQKSPDDVKLLETLGFVFAVCYSDHQSAIACYEKVFNLVTDDTVKERTSSLIARLRETEQAQASYQQEISAQLRDERLKTWSEMEKLEKFGDENAALQEKSSQLAEAYKVKDSLKNKVPQLSDELKELQEEYDKANRLWFSLKDDLYERRRRRLKDDIAAKEAELAEARSELDEVETTTTALERELSAVDKEKEASPIRSYEESTDPQGAGSENPGSESEPVSQPPSNDYGSPEDDSASGEEQPLPADNPDFPVEDGPKEGPVEGPDAEQKLDELIENL
ncbi:MAG: hypothetical protein PHD82_09490 [Candidatus Riflebacteria bacterium]|nr:hypothetical protein [Candidatus Riflebacteria bacterium]